MSTIAAVKTAQIKCINKDPRLDPYRRITHVGGYATSQWKLTVAEAIQLIERREWRFFVERPRGDRVWVVVAVSKYGNKYLRTEADGDEPNNLLSLPECP
jgi:hypothetical protein